MQYFFDVHCHLFNLEHIPLYVLLSRFNLDLAKIPALLLGLNQLLKEHRKFFTFFESDIAANIQTLTGEIDAALSRPGLDFLAGRKRVLTPLIMDFEKIPGAGHEKLITQVVRLRDTLRQKAAVPSHFKILPFLGIDLRRFDTVQAGDVSRMLQTLAQSLLKEGLSHPGQAIGKMKNGQVVGIKLYPPLGFDPFPEDRPALRKRYLALFRAIADLDLPITIHCQPGAYQPDSVGSGDLKRNTTPANWRSVLESPGLENLRINLAHFGGEGSVADTVHWNSGTEKAKFWNMDTTTWTHAIVRLVKQYPNAYADISAFDFTDDRACNALAWLLARDENDENFKKLGPYALKDKLLWGSDYPMPIGNEDFSTYGKQFTLFCRAMDPKGLRDRERERPIERYKKKDLPPRNDLLERLTGTNPRRFLFGF